MTESGNDARDVHRGAIVVDTVNRSLMDERFFDDIMSGGVTVLGRTILVSDGHVFSPFGFLESLRGITETLTTIENHPHRLQLVTRGRDFAEAKASGRVGLYIYFQSPEPLERQLWRLTLFHRLGLRVLQLTYNQRGYLGDGCAEPNDGGLSDFGRTVIAECNRLGIAVDASHCGDRTTTEALEVSSQPVLLTHAMARGICDNRRCKTDAHLKTCAERGGVIGIQALPAFVSSEPNPTLDEMLDHVDYLRDLVGVNHIGLGLDLTTGHERDDYSLLGYKPEMYQGVWVDGVQQTIPGIASLADLPNITDRLLARGYSDQEVAKILGANFVRVLSSIWDAVVDDQAARHEIDAETASIRAS